MILYKSFHSWYLWEHRSFTFLFSSNLPFPFCPHKPGIKKATNFLFYCWRFLEPPTLSQSFLLPSPTRRFSGFQLLHVCCSSAPPCSRVFLGRHRSGITKERTNTIPFSKLLLQQQLMVKNREEDTAPKQKHFRFAMLCWVVMLAPPQYNLHWEQWKYILSINRIM